MDMSTVPCDMIDGESEEDDSQEEETTWGRFFPLGSSFVAVDLKKDELSFGRGDNCDVAFNSDMAKKHQCFQAYSKIHFKLIRKHTSSGIHVFLEDTSSNGTFVNGEKVGKGNKQVLANNDEIALAMKKNKAFVYMDLTVNEDADLPQEIREKYTLTKTLGRGACGEVKLAFSKGSCEKFAVKLISKKKFSVGGKNQVNLSKQVMSEVKILKALKHPCIIGIEDVIDTPEMLVEGGELFDKVVSIDHYDEPTAKLLFYQMVLAVKPENILLSSENNETLIKVTDFGLSKFVDAGSIMRTFCGTPTYLAPEILVTAGNGALSGYPPFSDERTDMDLPKQIMGGHYTFPKQYWTGISDKAIDLIKKMMTVDPKKRITLGDAINHPWFKPNSKKRSLEGGEDPSAKRKTSTDTSSPPETPT
ncbi:hypothetical protein KUTeg_009806 [Tegillarca granosa]|uniref:Serine/threonine-protein kinase Chk2 n=1 Tax=Tegillarca granosa TaxID=220873 RepID=A0ABQ9F9Y9_TEGGR|nr:hypothetical protein KUTeg_009806 [Tegillarca granosa]